MPFLLRLLDDPSANVREKISARLCEMGDEVWLHIEEQQLPLSPAQRHMLREILASGTPRTVVAGWPDWLALRGENEKLEAAFCWLATREWGEGADTRLRSALDGLARDYLFGGGMADPEELSHFLFQERNLAGAPAEEYYDPRHSDLLYVIESGQGLPISLCCIFMLVGWRLDISIYGCNFPGHFLVRAPLMHGEASEEDLLFDPFNAGRILSVEEVAALRKVAPDELSTPATAHAIIARVLRNLANAYYQRKEEEPTREVLALLARLEEAVG